MRQLLLLSIIYMCFVYVEQVNIAYNASVESHHCDYALNVVDGNESTCTTFTKRGGEPSYLILDLGRKVKILEVDLVNPNAVGDSLYKFGISLSQDNVKFKPTYWYQRTEFPVITEPVRKSEIIAQFVRIEPNGTEGISTLCEIEITGDIYAMVEPMNVGVIAGTVSAVVGVIIVIVISIVIVKTRRRRETTEKEKNTSRQNVDNIEHDISKAYYNTEDSRKQRSEPIHNTNINGAKRGPDVSLHSSYEKLRDRMETEAIPYSVIDHGLTDNNGRSTLDDTVYYNEEFSSPEEL